MGLDMYLYAKLYLSKYINGRESDAEELRKRFGVPQTDNLNTVIVEFEIAYWHKANQIHKWFVDNVQDGKDDCDEYNVPRESLENLLSVTNEVLQDKDKAPVLLPVQEGFFFGSYEYDDLYFSNLQRTKEQIERALELPEEFDFYYHSSW